MSEIKIFTLLENFKKENYGNDLSKVLQSQNNLVGLPQMLGYKVSKQVSEIMMTHGGHCLEDWMTQFSTI